MYYVADLIMDDAGTLGHRFLMKIRFPPIGQLELVPDSDYGEPIHLAC